MSEVTKDSAIKLFGKTISPDKLFSDASLSQHRHSSSTSLDSKDESGNPSEEKAATSSGNSAKKPEKIIPCPRCKSMETKFCYFNNYNVNQPRHFCKQCQRYWTCGGTMRNVAVGSGRRKTKSALDHTDTDTFLFSFYCIPPPSLLGKHSRDGLLVPKTLRIHDPTEAAKSSIWTTLGINKDGVGMFRGSFESKGAAVDDRALLLRANPAAFSRSLSFHERA